jgi:hypothetical protein
MILLGCNLEDARRRGIAGPVTLNVVCPAPADRGVPGQDQPVTRDLVQYYQQLGFEVRPTAAGYTAHGEPREPRDLWMVGSLVQVIDQIRARAAGRRDPRAGACRGEPGR